VIQHENIGYNKTKEVLFKKYDNYYEGLKSTNPFNGIQDLLDPSRMILEEGSKNLQSYQEKVLIDTETKEIFYRDTNQKNPGYLRASEFKKGQLFKELMQENFNFFIFSPENEVMTEELTSLFLPECSLLNMVQVLIKPNATIYATEIMNTLIEMGFQIPYRKKLILNPIEAEKLVNSINENMEDSQDLVNFWSSENIEIVSLVKMACKKEVFSLLSKEKSFFIIN